jgi:methylisocitrate lyase
MLLSSEAPGAKRAQLRADLASGRLLAYPGAFNALSALLITELGFDGVYVSGAVLAADLGLPDIGLTTLSEVAARSSGIAAVTNLPTIVDADTGFGEPMNVARTIQILENAGLSGCHLEDQENPKRCGHLDGKSLVSTEDMVRRLSAAVGARRDAHFVICARTDARAVDGLTAAIERAKAYVDAGADMIFAEALETESEFEAFRAAIDAPILVNMTEFGKTPLFERKTLEALGMNMVIYPVTLLRIAMGAVERALGTIKSEGTQAGLVEQMQTRARLYELVDYAEYSAFDADIFNFKLPTTKGSAGTDGH